MGRLTHRTSPGWTYFATTKCWQCVAIFEVRENAGLVIAKLLEYRDKGNYLLHDFVLMPNHLHLILTPARSTSLEKAMQFIKGGSSHTIHASRGAHQQIWQAGFHESRAKDSADYKIKADYIRFNPVTAKLVERPEEWHFGSGSGLFVLDPIPQGLKPFSSNSAVVGAEAPSPKPYDVSPSVQTTKP
jgi:putative transposase